MTSIRRIICLIVLLSVGLHIMPLFAQTEAAAIETLAVDLWPDFDRPAVLVLLTGTLPPDTQFPTAVTIPLPPNAELNAVARITADNMMTDDIDFTMQNNQVTFTTPDARFRVEYYLPYTADGDERAFTFTWLADIPVTAIDVAIQQPLSAAEFHTQPIATSISQDNLDGFTYHVLPTQAVSARQAYDVTVNYITREPALSINQPQPVPATADTPASVNNANWPLYLAITGGVLIITAVIWQAAIARKKPKQPTQTKARTRPKPQTARFCHECGSPLQSDDKFCRSCGTAVKRPPS